MADPSTSNFSTPLLRIWDKNSGSKLDSITRLQARLPRCQIGSQEERMKRLAIHANWNKREPTPFISFASSIQALQRIISKRNKWTERKLTVINPNVRIAKGLPVLEMKAEMKHYKVQDPYDRSYRYYEDEYLCLWEVSPDEVVGRWNWDILTTHPHWYKDIILMAFREHNDRFEREMISKPTFYSGLPGMSSSFAH